MQADGKRGLGQRSVALAAIARPVNSLKTALLQFERQVVQLAPETAVAEDLAGVKSPAGIDCLMFARATALRRQATCLKGQWPAAQWLAMSASVRGVNSSVVRAFPQTPRL
jgi:hypothetical protein